MSRFSGRRSRHGFFCMFLCRFFRFFCHFFFLLFRGFFRLFRFRKGRRRRHFHVFRRLCFCRSFRLAGHVFGNYILGRFFRRYFFVLFYRYFFGLFIFFRKSLFRNFFIPFFLLFLLKNKFRRLILQHLQPGSGTGGIHSRLLIPDFLGHTAQLFPGFRADFLGLGPHLFCPFGKRPVGEKKNVHHHQCQKKDGGSDFTKDKMEKGGQSPADDAAVGKDG